MARKRSSENAYVVRAVRSKEDRKRPTVYMRLKTDESFRGYALFEPDPDLEDNPGYFEYYDHWDEQARQYVPCAGERCPFCAANDNPSTRAITAWYFPDAGDVKDQIKLFTMNFSTINDTTDESEEEDGILGKMLRIKRLSDKGDYRVKVASGPTSKPLTKAQLKKAMALLSERYESMKVETLQELVGRSLKAQMERLRALDALEDDDEMEDEEDTPKARRGRPKAEIADDDETDDDEEEEDEDDEDDEQDEDETDDEEDEDEEEDDEDEEEDEDEEDEDEDEDNEISGGVYEVVKADSRNDKFDLKNEDGKITVWLGQGLDVDYEEIVKGSVVVIDAQMDAEGDWVATSFEEQEEEKPKPTRRRATKR